MSSWAKAPDLGAPLREATRAEIREFLAAGLRPVVCQGCANRVLVKKSSPEHTSVQWLSDPVTSCPEFAARVAAGELSARIDTCPKLRASIEQAAAEGLLASCDPASLPRSGDPGGSWQGGGGPATGPSCTWADDNAARERLGARDGRDEQDHPTLRVPDG